MTTSAKVWIVVVLIALIGAYEWMQRSPSGPANPPPPPPIHNKMTQKILGGAWDTIIKTACQPARGNADAPWTMVEIGDFQCPQCGKVHSTVEQLIDSSHGKVKLYFINWPLQMHNNARRAASAALAAEKQGKFWPMYNAIYTQQKGISETTPADADSTLLDDAYTSKLDVPQYEKDRKSQEIADRLNTQANLVTSLGTQSTPTFLLRKAGGALIYYFIGSRGQDATPSTPVYPGLDYVIDNPPWNGAKLPPPPDVAPTGTYHVKPKT